MDGKNYKRRIYIINKKFQFRYVFIILFLTFAGIFTISFITFYVIWSNVINEFFFIPEAAKKLGDIYIKTTELLIIPLLIIGFIFSIIGILYSHKIAGPLYRVQKICEEISKGNLNLNVKFRKGDEFHEVADSLNKVIQGLKNMVREDKEIIEKLFLLTEKLKRDIATQKDLKKDVKITIEELDNIVKELKKSTEKFIL